MFDLNQTLNKLKLAEMLADAKMARRMRTSEDAKQVAFRSTAPHQASTVPAQASAMQRAQRPNLTDTEALTRKVREDMVRNAQAAFAEVMAELKASQPNTAPDNPEPPAVVVPEETEDAILSHHLIQSDHVGEA